MSKLQHLLKSPLSRCFSRGSIFLSQDSLNNNPPDLDFDYLCNPKNVDEISKNIASRKGMGNIELVQSLKNKLDSVSSDDANRGVILKDFINEAMKIPNRTHPAVKDYGEKAQVIREVGSRQSFDFEAKEFEEIAKRLKLLRTDQLGNVSGNRSYFFLGDMAALEQALIRYTLRELLKHKFQLYSVPDLLERRVIESCGMNTKGERNQVNIYR